MLMCEHLHTISQLPGIITLPSAHSAMRNPPKANQCCNLPQAASRHAEHALVLSEVVPGASA
eukprot:973606-Alexandrium_andersonii.AAC.1